MTESQHGEKRSGVLPRTVAVITVVELTIGVIALLAILALVFAQAAQRYSPFEGFAWTGELARFSLVWLTFSAMGLLVTSRGHIALEIADSIRNPAIVRAVQVFALVIVAATGAGLAFEAWALIETQGILASPVLRLPMSVVYIPVLIGALSTAIRAAIGAVDVAMHGPVLAESDETEGAVA